MVKSLWGGSDLAVDAMIHSYTSGEDHLLDEQLVKYDCQASRAHAKMLFEQGHLVKKDFDELTLTLHSLEREHGEKKWHIQPAEEDCHTAIENQLVARIGEAGRRIHLGRSRNDQVLVALRLWLRDESTALISGAESVAHSFHVLIEKQGHFLMPGYTHLQRAMPSSVKDWASGFAAEITDDAEGIKSAQRRIMKNPLGSAAGYGVPAFLKLNRNSTTQSLGFIETQEPVTSVQLSRGKAEAGLLFEAALLAQDLGRLSADLCLFSSQEFSFVRLPEKFTTGSSIMPQKRNPDVFELARGRTAEAFSALYEVMGITQKMTSGYHRDFQLMKKPLFRGIHSVKGTLQIMAHALPELLFNQKSLESAVTDDLYAAERAYKLVVNEGLSFRDAYMRVKKSFLGNPS